MERAWFYLSSPKAYLYRCPFLQWEVGLVTFLEAWADGYVTSECVVLSSLVVQLATVIARERCVLAKVFNEGGAFGYQLGDQATVLAVVSLVLPEACQSDP